MARFLHSLTETPKPSDAQPKARPAGRAAAAAAAAKAQYADPASEDEHSDGASAQQAERGPTPRNRASTYGGMAGPSKPRAQKRKAATSGKVGGRKKHQVGADEEEEPDEVVPSSRLVSDAESEEENETASKQRRLDKGKGKGKASANSPTPEEWTFDFPMVKISTDDAFLPENEDGQVDLPELPRTLDTPCLHFSLAKVASLTPEQSRVVARDRVRANLPPFEDESALLQAMDKPSVERLALDLHSLAEKATMQVRHELGSLLALANFQRQHIERCHAAMNARDVPILTMTQDDQGGADGLSVE